MARITFPVSPTLNQQYVQNGSAWTWDGTKWVKTAPEITQIPTASYVNITGSGVLVNYGPGGQIQLTGSAGASTDTLQNVTTRGGASSSSINLTGPVTASNLRATGSLFGTASWAQNAISTSYALSSSYAVSASRAVTASYALTSSVAVSASYALSSSYALTSSAAISASYALSSSYALTASFVLSASYARSSSWANTSSVALTASYVPPLQAVTSQGNLTTSSLVLNGGVTGSSFTGSFTGSFKGTASFADNVILQGLGITVNGMQLTASVRTVNGIFPTSNGNVATSLNAVYVGDSGSFQVSKSLATFTGSLAIGSVWVFAGSTGSASGSNGTAYIYTTSSVGVGQWYELGSSDLAQYDARYLMLAGTNSPMQGNVNWGGYKIENLGNPDSSDDAINLGTLTSSLLSYTTTASFHGWTGSASSLFFGTSSYAVTTSYAFNAMSSSYALTASYASTALSASYSLTASLAYNTITASHALTASSVNTLDQNVDIWGTLTVGRSGADRNMVFGGTNAGLYWGTVSPQTASIVYNNGDLLFTSVNRPSNMILDSDGGAIFNYGITGSLLGTASWAVSASNALTASYVNITGSGVLVNYNGSQIQLTASVTETDTLQTVTTRGNETSASVYFTPTSSWLGGKTILSASIRANSPLASLNPGAGLFLTSVSTVDNINTDFKIDSDSSYFQFYGERPTTSSVELTVDLGNTEIVNRVTLDLLPNQPYGYTQVRPDEMKFILADTVDDVVALFMESSSRTVSVTGSLKTFDPTGTIGGNNLVHLIPGPNITITSGSTGYIISGSAGGGGLTNPLTASLKLSGSLSIEGINAPNKNFILGNGILANGSGNTASADYSHAEGVSTTATGQGSHAEGNLTTATGNYAHAEGQGPKALAGAAHAEGYYTTAISGHAHAEGSLTTAASQGSHAEGTGSVAYGLYSHTEGDRTTTINADYSHAEGGLTTVLTSWTHAEGYQTIGASNYSHAEGRQTTTKGTAAHSEGYLTTAVGVYSHAEGESTLALGQSSHAEGNFVTASGNYSHAEGWTTRATGTYSHAEGSGSFASGFASHAEGRNVTASGNFSHAEGFLTVAQSLYSHAEGAYNRALGLNSHAEGGWLAVPAGNLAEGEGSHAEGVYASASGQFSHAEGSGCRTVGSATHAEGWTSTAIGAYSHAEGKSTTTIGQYSHTEGNANIAIGDGAHAEGESTRAIGISSHAEGVQTTAKGNYSHAEGNLTVASGSYSHAEGQQSVATGLFSHVEGWLNQAIGLGTHVEGWNNVATVDHTSVMGNNNTSNGFSQVVVGQYNNIATTASGAFIVGAGNAPGTRQNALEIYWDGAANRGVVKMPTLPSSSVSLPPFALYRDATNNVKIV